MQNKTEDIKYGLIEPQERLKILSNYSNAVEVDPNIPPKRYYRSGIEMVRMANVYYEEGNLENAYVLYMKYMTLFIEKIRKHPDYAQVPPQTKSINQEKLRDILPKAEKIKAELLHQYKKERELYIAITKKDNEEKQKIEEERMKKEQLEDEKKKKTRKKTQKEPKLLVQVPVPIENINYPDPNLPSVPSRSDKKEPKVLPPAIVPNAKPSINRKIKPTIDSSTSLRKVIIPGSVMPKFLLLAKHNTFSNIETCGILAGILEQNKLIITHMILPKQKGTSDSCTTMNEEEIFDYQDQFNLITIGWIHTHPTQTAFLSSVDLHTHCPYQLLMPEAIAIVCAPKYNDTGIYVLTPNHGLGFIANCRNTGFHPHPSAPPLFMVAEHIKLDGNATLEVLDLRT